MKLSNLKIGDIAAIGNKRFIVTLLQGGNIVVFDNGSIQRFDLDYNDPEVEFIGRGRLVTRIEQLA